MRTAAIWLLALSAGYVRCALWFGAGVFLCAAQPRNNHQERGAPGFEIIAAGPDYALWQKAQPSLAEPGRPPGLITNRYVELATGLNRWDGALQGWLPAQALFERLADGGFAARRTAHRVSLAANLKVRGAVELVLPDGRRLRSTPLGIGAVDTERGVSVLLAELKPCRPVLIGTNEVAYLDAFDSLRADVRYRLSRAGLEQDVILREPIAPAALTDLGLSPAATRLVILTEFFNAPEPTSHRRVLERAQSRAPAAEPTSPDLFPLRPASEPPLASNLSAPLWDEELDFGSMRIGAGSACAFPPPEGGAPEGATVPVGKSWELLDGRRFLIESVEYRALLPWFKTLSPTARAAVRPPYRPSRTGKVMPPAPPAPPAHQAAADAPSDRAPHLAAVQTPFVSPGVLIDYPIMLSGSKTNYTFRGDTTYYLSGPFMLEGTNTVFEAGTVIKYAPGSSARLTLRSPLTWQGSLYCPVILTARDDHSVGEAISATPLAGYYAAVALDLDALWASNALVLEHLRIAHAQTAVAINGRSGHAFSHAQIVNCQTGFQLANANLRLRNALLHNVATNFSGYGATVAGEHLTIDTSAWLNPTNVCLSLSLTNSLLVAVANPGLITSSNNVALLPAATNLFTRTLAGAHYLASDTWRNRGTTNLCPDLRTQLANLTTYAPALLTNRCATNTTLGPTVRRDTDLPDLGYHYAPLDYVATALEVTNATLLLTNGVCLGAYGQSLFLLRPTGRLVSEGHPLNLNRLVPYQAVQEQSQVWITNTATWCLANGANLDFRFTELPFLAAAPSGRLLLPAGPFNGTVAFRDCRLRGACLNFFHPPASGCPNPSLAFTNNLLQRCSFALAQGDTNLIPQTAIVFAGSPAVALPPASFAPNYLTLACRNNLLSLSTLNLAHWSAAYGTWDIHANLFDQCNVSLTEYGAGGTATNPAFPCSYNAFLNTANPFRQPTDRTGLARDFVRGPLGDYYYPDTGPPNSLASLVNADASRTADTLGLYHYTTLANQQREGNSPLDLGFHYLAVTNRNGTLQPLDTDGDGTPDYREDRNGNGRLDPGETPFSALALTLPPLANYLENQTARPFDSPGTTVTEANPCPPDFLGGTLTVGIVTNAQPTDVLGLTNVPALGIRYASNQLSFQGAPVGTVAGAEGRGPLVVTFNAQATPTAVAAVLRAVTFRIASDQPNPAPRTLRVGLTDGHGAASPLVDTSVTVTPVNDPPTLSINPDPLLFARTGPPVAVASGASATDLDTVNFAGAHLSAAISLNAQAEDRLTLFHQGTGPRQVGLSGTNITCGGLSVGWFSGGLGLQPLIVGFNQPPAIVSADTLQAVLQAIQYQNLSQAPFVPDKVLRFVVTDNAGGHAVASRPLRIVCADRLDCLLVIDQSSSTRLPTNDPALPHLQDAARLFLSYLRPGADQVGIVAFNQTATNLLRLTTDFDAARQALQTLCATGTTRIDLAIATAQAELASPRHRSDALPLLILITDGRQIPAGNDPVIAAAADATRHGTTLVTIGLGYRVDTNLLQTIASGPVNWHFSPAADDLKSIYTAIAQNLCRARNQPPQVFPGAPFALTFIDDRATTNLHGAVTDDGLPATNRLALLWSLVTGPGPVQFQDPQTTNTAITLLRPPTPPDASASQPLIYTLSLTAHDGQCSATSNLTLVAYPDSADNHAPYVDPGPPQTTVTNLPLLLPGRVIDDGHPSGAPLTARWTQLSGPAPVAFANPASAHTTALFTIAGDYLLQLLAHDTLRAASNTVPITVCEGPAAPADIVLLVDESASMSAANKITLAKTGARAFLDAVDLAQHAVAIVGFAETAIVHAQLTHDAATLHQAIDQMAAHTHSALPANTYLADGLAAAWDQFLSPRHNPRAWPLAVLLSDGLPSDDPLPIAQAAKQAGLTLVTAGLGLDDQGTAVLRTLASSDADFHSLTDPTQIQTLYLQVAASLCLHHNRRPIAAAGPDLVVNPGDTPLLNAQAWDDGPTNNLRFAWNQLAGAAPITFNPPDALATRLTGLTVPGTNVLRLTVSDGEASSTDELALLINACPLVQAGPDQDLLFSPTLIVTLAARASDPDAYPQATWSTAWTQLSGPASISFLDGSAALTGRLCGLIPGTYLLRLDASDGLANASDQLTLTVRSPLAVNAGPDIFISNFNGASILTLTGSISNRAGVTYTRGWTKTAGPAACTLSNPASTTTTATLTAPGTYVLRLAATNTLTGVYYDDLSVFVGTAGNQPPTVSAGPDQALLAGDSARLSGTVTDDGKPKPACTVQWSQVQGPGAAAFLAPDALATTATFTAPGRYVLRLTADDGQLTARSEVVIQLNAPPLVSLGATNNLGLVLRNQPITLQGNVTDDGLPAGTNLTVRWTQLAGPGTVRFADPTAPITAATFDTQGLYTLQLLASDGLLTARQPMTVTVLSPPTAHPDTITLELDPQAAPAQTVLDVLANDSDPEGDPLTIISVQPYPPQEWYGTRGTVCILNHGTQLGFTPDQGLRGFGHFAYTISDGHGGQSTAEAWLAFRPRNRPPRARPDSFFVPADSTTPIPLDVLANDDDPDGQWLTVRSFTPPAQGRLATSVAPSPLTTTDGRTTALAYQPYPGFRGRDAFTYTAADPAGATSIASVTLDVGPDPYANQPPTAFAGPDRSTTTAQGLDLAGDATDDGLPDDFLSFQWTCVSGPAPGQFLDPAAPNTHVDFPATGTYLLRLAVSDGPTTATDDTIVTVLPDTFRPVAALLNLTNGFTLAHPIPTITNGCFDLIGTARPGRPNAQLTYRLDLFSPSDGLSIPAPVPGFTPVAASQPVSADKLATLDFTRVRNGIYDLVLTVQADGLSASAETRFSLDSELKLGRLTFAESDYTLPFSGLPLAVIRRYDSLNPAPGDFGYGWTLALFNFDVQTDEERTLTFDQDPADCDGQPFSLRSGGWRDLSLTLPEGRRVTFTFSLRKGLASYYAQWSAPPGVFASLVPTVSPQLVTLPALRPEEAVPPYWQAAGLQTPASAFDFPGFNLTLPDGTLYELRRPDLGEHILPDGTYVHAYATPALARLVRPDGEALLVNSNRLDHLNALGQTNASLCFDRVHNLITALRDPLAPDGPPLLKYDYDAQTNLWHVGRLLDRATGAYATNTYCYANPTFPHYVTSIINPSGVPILQNEYDQNGKLIAATDALGNITRFADQTITNANQILRLQTVTDPAGARTTHYCDARGNLTRTIDPLGFTVLREFDADDRLLSETLPLTGTETTYPTTYHLYDAAGRCIATTDPLGNTSRTEYNHHGQITATTDPLGHSAQYHYDAAGHLVAALDPAGNLTRFTYDNRGCLVSTFDPLGLTITNQYDPAGNLISSTSLAPDGTPLSALAYAYDPLGNRTQQTLNRTLPDGRTETLVSRWVYDAQNRLIHSIAPDGSAQRTLYDLNGRPRHTIDPLGRTNSFAYDPRGLLTNHVFPDGRSVTFTYDATGRRTSTTDRAGRTTTFLHDPRGRLTATFHPDGTSNLLTYTPAGQIASTTDARGYLTAYLYDHAGRLTAANDALGNLTQFAYDAAGNLTNTVDALGQITAFQYDALNRRTRTLLPNGTATTDAYDPLGRRIAATDPANLTTRFAYDPLGRLTALTNALLDVTRYTYDQTGNRLAQTDALNRLTRFHYDPCGRRTKRTLPDGATETFAYDAAGNRLAHTHFNGHTVRFQYDALDRLTNKYWLNGTASNNLARYSWLPDGSLAQRTDPTGTYAWTYDNRGRVSSYSTPAGTLYYSYDQDGNLTRIKSATPAGTDLTYTWDPLNRLVAVNDPAWSGLADATATLTYDPAGRLQNTRYPNNLNRACAYDPCGRPTNVTLALSAASTPLATFTYTLGPAGNRLALTEQLPGANRSYAWSCDALYRLATETLPGPTAPTGTLAYRYDPVANRTSRTAAGTLASLLPSTTAAYTPNDGLAADSYDNDGNTLRSGTVACGYDVLDRLVAWTNGTTVVTFAYDDDGNRVRRTQGSITTFYLIDRLNPTGYPQVLEESLASATGPATLTRVYSWGRHLLSARHAAASLRFYAHDAHGSTRLLTDSRATLTDTYTYDAWGNLIAQTGSTPNNYLYTTEYLDPTLSLYYLRARYYNPNSGRFWSADPAEGCPTQPLSLNRYAYAHGNPLENRDPTGCGLLTVSVSGTLSSSLDSVYNGTVTSVGNALMTTVRGIQEGKLSEEIAYDFIANTLKGAAIAVGIGAGISIVAEAWQQGAITLAWSQESLAVGRSWYCFRGSSSARPNAAAEEARAVALEGRRLQSSASTSGYGYVDRIEGAILEPGYVLYSTTAPAFLAKGGKGAWFTNSRGAYLAAGSQLTYENGAQLAVARGFVRDRLYIYRVTTPTPCGFGVARENFQNGAGGFPEYYVRQCDIHSLELAGELSFAGP